MSDPVTAATTPDSSAAAPATLTGAPPVADPAASTTTAASTTEGTATTPETTAADPAAKAAETPAVPEVYEAKLPEGMQVDTKGMEDLQAFAKTQKFTQEQFQAALDLQVANVARQVEAQKAQTGAWLESVKADAELGGQRFDTTAKNAVAAVTKFGNQALRDFLNSTGVGNHPEWVRFAAKIGAAMSEDSVVPADRAPAGAPKAVADVMYDRTK